VTFATDKIAVHGYFRTYVRLAAAIGPRGRVLELGVAEGESLRMWQALFPEGTVTGVDVNPDATWPEGTTRIVAQHDDPALPGMLSGQYNLIVDDGCHDGAAVRRSFALLWPLVAPGGSYVVEDWMVSLRAAERPGENWGRCWGPSMLQAVQCFLPLLDYPDSDCESVEYRYGLAIVRKRNEGCQLGR
jgi:Methyltransferase domain